MGQSPASRLNVLLRSVVLASVRIQNFRAFSDFKVEGLARLNLLIGRNGSGKTTLLEALFLLLGAHNPEIPVRLNVLRGTQPFAPEPDDTWGWLFRDKLTRSPIVVEATQDDGTTANLELSLDPGVAVLRAPGDKATLSGPGPAGSHTTGPARRLVLRFTRNGQQIDSSAYHAGDRVELQGAQTPAFPNSFFLSTHGRSPDEDARRFGMLEEAGRDNELVQVLKTLEPRLKRLSVYLAGDRPALRADVGIGRLVPVAYLGEGFVRTVSMVLAATTAPNGCVLIDEFDNGLHYSVLPAVWAGLGDAIRSANAQLIATTHSRECVAAAHGAAKSQLQYDLAVKRLERTERAVQAVPYTQESLETALSLDWELR